MVPTDENRIFSKIRDDDKEAFRTLFETYYASLCLYASHFLNDDVQAEEVVQDLFVRLWEKRMELTIETSLRHYLFRSVRNHCLNLIRQEKVRKLHAVKLQEALLADDTPEDYFISPELMLQMEAGIASLPEKRREIFRLSREEGLKYREIAGKLNISVKTVEAQMGLALQTLRKKIRTFLFLFT